MAKKGRSVIRMAEAITGTLAGHMERLSAPATLHPPPAPTLSPVQPLAASVDTPIPDPDYYTGEPCPCPVDLLIDSGTDYNLIEWSLAQQLALMTISLERPLETSALDGQLLLQVTHRTVPVAITISGNHSEEVQFFIIESSIAPLKLRFPWLKKHNPHSDCEKGEVWGWSPSCSRNCLYAASSIVPAVSSQPVEPIYLTNVLEEYQDLTEVFSQSRQ